MIHPLDKVYPSIRGSFQRQLVTQQQNASQQLFAIAAHKGDRGQNDRRCKQKIAALELGIQLMVSISWERKMKYVLTYNLYASIIYWMKRMPPL
jgi:hypothetical protein